jgi:hypothetical protein
LDLQANTDPRICHYKMRQFSWRPARQQERQLQARGLDYRSDRGAPMAIARPGVCENRNGPIQQLIAAARLPNSGISEIAVNSSLAFIEGASLDAQRNRTNRKHNSRFRMAAAFHPGFGT